MQNLTQLLAHSLLQPIIRKAEHLNSLNQRLHTLLSADWGEHCCVANVEGSCLTLEVKNGAWATRGRFETPELLKRLKTAADFIPIESIRWKIQVQTQQDKPVLGPPGPVLAESVRNALITSSQHIKNAKLKASMERLARSIN